MIETDFLEKSAMANRPVNLGNSLVNLVKLYICWLHIYIYIYIYMKMNRKENDS